MTEADLADEVAEEVAEDGHRVRKKGRERAPAFSMCGAAAYQDMVDRSFTKIGMSFHRPLTFLLATTIHCGW